MKKKVENMILYMKKSKNTQIFNSVYYEKNYQLKSISDLIKKSTYMYMNLITV